MKAPKHTTYSYAEPIHVPGCDPCYPHGTKLTFKCEFDYWRKRGPDSRTCSIWGGWDQTLQRCEAGNVMKIFISFSKLGIFTTCK